MTTKPVLFALLGSGRLARHLNFYLKALALPVVNWSRNGDPQFNSYASLPETLAKASHVLLALRDDALREFATTIPESPVRVHFSGALHIPGVIAAHPLMTFGPDLAAPDWYKKIPFVLDQGHRLDEVLPGLPNPTFALPPSQRSLYHALCSLAGNSTFLLWRQIGDQFERELGLPRAVLTPFLEKVVHAATQESAAGFTGPVARGDWQTVEKHLQALGHRPALLQSYKSYLNLANNAGYSLPEVIL